MIELVHPYYIEEDTEKVKNIETNKYIKVTDYKCKIKIDGKLTTIDLRDYVEFSDENNKQNNIEINSINTLKNKFYNWNFKCIETGQKFNTIEEASKTYGINKRSVALSLLDRRKVCHKYTFKYKNSK